MSVIYTADWFGIHTKPNFFNIDAIEIEEKLNKNQDKPIVCTIMIDGWDYNPNKPTTFIQEIFNIHLDHPSGMTRVIYGAKLHQFNFSYRRQKIFVRADYIGEWDSKMSIDDPWCDSEELLTNNWRYL